MNLRVNLLRPSEQRYQGPVSTRFALSLGGIMLGVLLLVSLLWSLHAFVSVRRGLSARQAEWQRIEPRYKDITDKEQRNTEARALLSDLDKWGKLRPVWGSLLRELQMIAPPSVQFTRLSVRSEWAVIRPPPIVTAEGKEIPQPSNPARKFYFSVEGRASGELADEVVVQFERTLRTTPGFAPLFESVKLQRLVRDAGQSGDRQPDRLFLIEGEFLPRKLQ